MSLVVGSRNVSSRHGRSAPRGAEPGRRLGAGVVGILAATVLAGCGGSTQTASTVTRPPAGAVALRVQPGVGIGPISLGDSPAEIRSNTVAVGHSVGPDRATYDTPGGAVTVSFGTHGRAQIIASSSAGLSIYGGRLENQRTMIVRRMRADGWTVARCPDGALSATRKQPDSGRITRVIWPAKSSGTSAQPSAAVYPAHRSFPGEFGCPGAGARRPL